MKSKQQSAAEEAATKADIASEEQGEEPTEGVVMTAITPEKPVAKATQRPAAKKSTAAKVRKAGK